MAEFLIISGVEVSYLLVRLDGFSTPSSKPCGQEPCRGKQYNFYEYFVAGVFLKGQEAITFTVSYRTSPTMPYYGCC